MSQPQTIHEPMTHEEFFEFIERAETKYELVDGRPTIMSGGSVEHDVISGNGYRELSDQLDGKPCQARTSNLAVKIPAGNIRYPDVSVDCGELRRKEYCLDKPTLVIEVASRSTKKYDDVDKLDEYKTIPSMEYILLVETDRPCVRCYSRVGDDKWEKRVVIGMKSTIILPLIGASLSLENLYHGLDFDLNLDDA